MNHDDLSPNCGRVRNELASFLYGELAPDAREALELHLDGCVPCGEELAALRETQRLLARWETPAASEDPRQLARAIATRAGTPPAGPGALSTTALDARAQRRGRLVRWSARLAGAAAGLLFTFSLLNARASLEGGRLQLDFALPGARSDAPASAPLAGLEEQVRAIAAQEVAARSESFAQSQEELFQRCSQMTQQELLRLSQAVDYAMAQNQRSWDTKLTTLGREAARVDLETRRAITDLASYLPASNPTNR